MCYPFILETFTNHSGILLCIQNTHTNRNTYFWCDQKAVGVKSVYSRLYRCSFFRSQLIRTARHTSLYAWVLRVKVTLEMTEAEALPQFSTHPRVCVSILPIASLRRRSACASVFLPDSGNATLGSLPGCAPESGTQVSPVSPRYLCWWQEWPPCIWMGRGPGVGPPLAGHVSALCVRLEIPWTTLASLSLTGP